MGLWGKLTGLFGGRKDNAGSRGAAVRVFRDVTDDVNTHPQKTMIIRVKPPKQQYIIKVEGKYLLYNSKSDMPPELRKNLDKFESDSGAKSTYTVVIDGKSHTYHSLDEMPEEIRETVQKANRENQ